MIRGIHYFSAEVKPKLISSQGAALINVSEQYWFVLLEYQGKLLFIIISERLDTSTEPDTW